MDIAGNIYPETGEISAKEFTEDINIQYGLYGILWGRTPVLFYEKEEEGHWLVVKTKINDDFIVVDSLYNRVKFREGEVICYGEMEKIGKYVKKLKDNPLYYDGLNADITLKAEIVGTKEWKENRCLMRK